MSKENDTDYIENISESFNDIEQVPSICNNVWITIIIFTLLMIIIDIYLIIKCIKKRICCKK